VTSGDRWIDRSTGARGAMCRVSPEYDDRSNAGRVVSEQASAQDQPTHGTRTVIPCGHHLAGRRVSAPHERVTRCTAMRSKELESAVVDEHGMQHSIPFSTGTKE
jgi:hypothetical protein